MQLLKHVTCVFMNHDHLNCSLPADSLTAGHVFYITSQKNQALHFASFSCKQQSKMHFINTKIFKIIREGITFNCYQCIEVFLKLSLQFQK